MSEKLFIGPKLRKLRQGHKMSQARCAEKLGISHSYFNQLENNQRPVSASVLIKINQVFAVDVDAFATSHDEKLLAALNLVAKSEVNAKHQIHLQDLHILVQQQPDIAEMIRDSHQHLEHLEEQYQQLLYRFYGEQHHAFLEPLPHEQVRDYFYKHNNYISLLDEKAESFYQSLATPQGGTFKALAEFLQSYGVDISNTDNTLVEHGLVQRFDKAGNRLFLSPTLSNAQQCFHLASHIGLHYFTDDINTLIQQSQLEGPQTQQLLRIGLANYFAGALLMPYGIFLQAAEKNRYDIQFLQQIFDVSTEQVCHRLSTLQRPKKRGVPFYFVRVDQAGNISKRQSAGSFQFAKVGGACPLWNIHAPASTHNLINRQIARMPDGQQYFCLAIHIQKTSKHFYQIPRNFTIGLGCEIEHATKLVYSDDLQLQNPNSISDIGPGCRACPRENCQHRAFPPAGFRLATGINEQSANPYSFIKP